MEAKCSSLIDAAVPCIWEEFLPSPVIKIHKLSGRVRGILNIGLRISYSPRRFVKNIRISLLMPKLVDISSLSNQNDHPEIVIF
jgi:hypothetical protein